MDQTAVIMPGGCTDLGGRAYRLCLPTKEICDITPQGGGVKAEEELWNCIVCQPETKYNHPYVAGDLIQLQTLFYDSYNADKKQPSSGFGTFVTATIVGPDGSESSAAITRKMVAWGCNRSYQIIEIDTSLISVCPWNVKYEVFNAGGGLRKTVYSEAYEEADLTCGHPLLKIKGEEDGVDCFGYCHKEPEAYTGDLIEYDNTMRLWGTVKHLGGSFQKTEGQASGVKKIDLEESFSLMLGRKIPPYVHSMLLRQYLAAERLYINDVFYRADSVNIQNQVRTGRMFLYNVTITQDCAANGDC